ncbi:MULTISPECIES: hypothetical protein [unclassified Rhizobium]|uniref:hypothetical protein n=1 Tax=unclassified Rhizobium TaxID=2613769 RepID=UPI000A721B85|nr:MULTISPECIES: hypothetical protein [unclassified Rhizobium]RKD35987.1 hypothetical protein BJ928_12618 [Rhizobium sp. WW_1]
MKLWIIPAAAVAIVLSNSAMAKNFSIPDDTPTVKVTIPDDWSPQAIDAGAQGTSPDGSTYIAAEVLAADDVKAATEASMKVFLKDAEMKIDGSSMQSKQVDFGSTKATDITFNGSNEDGPQEFEIMLLPLPTDGKFLVISYWGTPDGDKANKAKFDEIMSSFDLVQ